MALATVIAGPYTGTWNSTTVGITEDGFRLRQTVEKEVVTGDAYGGSVIEGVYRGGQCFLIYSGIEAQDLVFLNGVSAFWPYGGGIGLMGQVGRVDTDLAKATVLTVVAGTPAATNNFPTSLTASYSIIDENFNGELIHAARARKVPITMRLYPYEVSSAVYWFTTT